MPYSLCSVLNACPPCADHRGEKRYCVKTDLLGLQTCVAASQKGGRCSSTQIKSGVYEGRPPCQEGLECSETMGGKCT
ncbi:hypothetical protein HNY73_006761 [Argiope bruennichi]|uniref:Uncharacterized protein n=1 Tax=Argiope bruennichi TaxID=94029 RepID=A0A8T0FEC7_ARGBR|nr:hypothetical protein HNY73_006761 [Argiope bruennichi]